MIKAGIIGAGFIGPAHVEALRRLGDVEVIALAASSQRSAEAKAQALHIPRAYGDWQDLVRDPDVQVVHNCTPNVLHHAVTVAATEAGKHVIAEKPLGMNSAETADLVRRLQATKLVGAVCFNYRMYPLVQEAKARVSAGGLGPVRLVHGCYLQDWLLHPTDYNWRVDARLAGISRAMADIGSHWCDLAQFVSGQRITTVCADLATFLPWRLRPVGEVETFAGPTTEPAAATEIEVETEDYGSVLLHLDGGARGAVTISQVSAGHKNGLRLEVNGSLGSLAWDQERANELWLGQRDRPNGLLIKDPSLLSETARRFAHYPGGHGEGYPDGFKNLLAHVYAFIREGKDARYDRPDFPTFADGHHSALVIEAIVASQQRGGWVSVGSVAST
jgi:predicted dehydrogenase